MALINCSECAHQISDKSERCVNCGAPVLKKETFKCFECGVELAKGVKTCPECGAEQNANPKYQSSLNVKNEKIPIESVGGRKTEVKPVQSEPPKAKSSNNFKYYFVIVLVVIIAFIYLSKHGYSLDSIINTPQTIDLSVACSPVTNLLITAEVTVAVHNNSTRTHNNVKVRLTAYDKDNNIIEEKTTTFERTLEPNGTLTKPVTLPARARRCICIIESSNPQ